MKFFVFNIAILLLLSGCADNKHFKNDAKNKISPDFLSNSKDINSEAPSDEWWKEFNDKLLNKLVAIGLKNNKDIKLSNLAITTSRELNNINLAEFFPSGSVALQRQSFGSPAFGPGGIKYSIFQAVANVSWEIDLLGKNLDRYKAGKLRFLKEMQIYKMNALRVAAEITQNYLALKTAEKQIANLEEILRAQEKLNEIAKKKEELGLTSKAEIYRARIQYDEASSSLISAKTGEKIIAYRLAVLLGLTPEKTLEILKNSNKKQIFDYSSGIVPVGLKSDILKRRPDIIAAEYEIDAALHDKSAQFKEFFPSFAITGSVGGGNKNIGQVLSDPTNVRNVAGGFSIPIFSYGSLLAQYKISKASAKSAVLNYEKTVLEALSDCESQLVNYINALKIEKNSADAKEASNKILQIAKKRKLYGSASSEEVLVNKIAALNSENVFAERKLSTLTYLISLHKSLGGGFEGYKMKFKKDQVLFVKDKIKKDDKN